MEEPAAGNPGRWRHGEVRLDRARGKIPAAIVQRSHECFQPIPFRHLVVIDEDEKIRIERQGEAQACVAGVHQPGFRHTGVDDVHYRAKPVHDGLCRVRAVVGDYHGRAARNGLRRECGQQFCEQLVPVKCANKDADP